MSVSMTKHATDRMQQRGVPPVIVDWLVTFGAERHQNGATVHYFDKRSRKNLDTYTGGLSRRLDKWLDLCVVLGRNNRVVTAYFRYSRIKGK